MKKIVGESPHNIWGAVLSQTGPKLHKKTFKKSFFPKFFGEFPIFFTLMGSAQAAPLLGLTGVSPNSPNFST
jgi:hypothetical protein